MQKPDKILAGLISWSVFAFFLVYIVLRAILLSFTHDESVTFGISHYLVGWYMTANNHILNTILMELTGWAFGYSELSLRLPNVLAFIMYFTGSVLILRETKNLWMRIFGLCLLLFHPFMIEFFALARGYGLTLGFMMLSLFYFLRTDPDKTSISALLRNLALAAVFAALATWSNFTSINFYIAVLLLFTYKYIILHRKNPGSRKQMLAFLGTMLLALLPLAFAMIRLLMMNRINNLHMGPSTFRGIFDSLILAAIYKPFSPHWIPVTARYTLIVFALAGVILIIRDRAYKGSLFYLALMNLLILVGLVLEHHLFGTMYPANRTALWLIPGLMLYIYSLTEHVKRRYNVKNRIMIPLTLIFMAPLVLSFIKGVNLSHSKTWMFDAHTKEAMEIIHGKTKDLDYKPTISNNWLFEPTINFYMITRDINLDTANREGVKHHTDFILRLDDTTTIEKYESLRRWEDTDSELLEKKNFAEKPD